MKRLINVVNEVEEKFLVGIFAITIILIFTQVVMRQFFNFSLAWSEELARYLFIWECWVGVSLAERYEKHIRITIVIDKLNTVGKKILESIVTIALIAAAILLIVYGIEVVNTISDTGSTSPALRIPMTLIYISMPVGCVLYAFRMIIKLTTIITGKEY